MGTLARDARVLSIFDPSPSHPVPNADPSPAPRLRHRLLRGLEALLWVGGFACLGWVAWTWMDAVGYQQRADASFDLPPVERPERPSSAPAPAAAPAPLPPTTKPGEAIGRIVVPSVDLHAVVAHGVDERTLRRAVGWMPASAPPGSRSGNVALAGHRDTFFRGLESVRVGDEIRLETRAGAATYRVEWIRVVEPHETEVAGPTEYPGLTLVTCYPFRYVGPAPQRYIVRARRIEEGDDGVESRAAAL